jgi:hypothetical protein
MGNKLLLILFLVGIGFCCGLVSAVATNFSVSDLGGLTAKQDIWCYYFNGTPCSPTAQFNTSSVGIEIPEDNFILVVRPTVIGRLSNPSTFLSDGFDWVETNWLQIVLVIVILLLFMRRR